MSCILFYGPFNQRSRDTESVMIAFRKQGHKVLCLTQQEGYLINDFLESNGVRAYAHVIPGPRSGWWYYFRHLLFFVRFCWRHKVNFIYSHLEPANFVASVGQYFIRAKTYLCRHHINESELYSFNNDLYYKITYSLARRIIVVSKHAKRYMIDKEGIKPEKIKHINLAYDFSLYDKANTPTVNAIREQRNAAVLLVTACRLTKYKRPDLSIKLVKRLQEAGVNAKLILLGQGEMQDELEYLITKLSVQDHVYMPGYVNNILDYMAAADFFVHPSLLESSCVAVKEAGLVDKPVIVCQGIGDFDEYLINGHNGFVVNQHEFEEQAAQIIVNHYHDSVRLNLLGLNLHKVIVSQFDITNVISQYEELNSAL